MGTLKFLSLLGISIASIVALGYQAPVSHIIENPDIVMVDTGQPYLIRGQMNIDPTICYYQPQSLCVHGGQMVAAMKDQLERVKAKPVDVVQISWANGADLISGILKAADMNPRVLSLSLSGTEAMPAEKNAISYAVAKGILVLAASGNDHGKVKAYPASYDLECLISVSTSDNGRLPETANPGEIYVPRIPGEDGTSFSTARAAAIAMRFFQIKPDASCKQAKAFLLRVFGQLQ